MIGEPFAFENLSWPEKNVNRFGLTIAFLSKKRNNNCFINHGFVLSIILDILNCTKENYKNYTSKFF